MRKILTLSACFILMAAFAQNRYELSYDHTQLDQVVHELSNKFKFKFSYNPKLLKSHSLTKKIVAQTDAELISQVFEKLPFNIQLADGIYLIIPKQVVAEPIALAGQVYDKSSGEPLAFAHVQTDIRGTVSNQNGRFSLPPRKDTLTLKVSYIGYKKLELDVAPDQENIVLSLEQDPKILQEVILNSSALEELSTQPSFFSLNPSQISSLPMLGETDVFKSIQLLPGVSATDETSSGLSIRGSTPGHNLVLMDGFTLYNLDHFFGIFSTLNPNVINNVSVYKGGFGAEYGGRISSVIDVTGKNGMPKKFSGGGGVNMLSANGYIQVPVSPKTSLMLGMRQSFTEIINSNLYRDFLTSNRQSFLESIDSDIAALDITPSLKFYDINGKMQHRFSDKSVLDVNLYLSKDNYEGNFIDGDGFSSFNVKDEANWANIGVSVDWKKQVSQKWFNQTIVSTSEFSEDERLAINQTFFTDVSFNSDSIQANSTIDLFDYSIKSSISDFTIKSLNEIALDAKNTLKAGLEFNSITTTYTTDQLLFQNFSEASDFADSLDIRASILSFYTGHEFRTEDFTTNLGLRASYFEAAKKWFVEPRFDMRFRINEQLNLKGAASFHHQFVSQNSLSPFQNTDQFYWILSDDEVIPVLKSTHFILGGSYSFGHWTADIEYYRKNSTGIIENQFLTIPLDILSFADVEGLNLSGENISEGLDFFIKYRKNIFTSWLSYSIGSSQNQFWYRNENEPYPSNQDQRHEINLSSMIKLGRWELSSIFLYGSGKPFTPPNPLFSTTNDSVSIYDLPRINSERLPAYLRMDISAKYSFPLGKVSCEAGLTLFNLFNWKNIKSRRYTVQYLFDENPLMQSSQDEARIIALDTNLLGFTPNFFFNIRF